MELQVEITMVIYETWGCKLKRYFENFAVLTFNPPRLPHIQIYLESPLD